MKYFFTPFLRVAVIMIVAIAGWSSAYATTFTVTNLNDSGAGSLRQAIIDANASGVGPHAINFAVTGIIPINSSLPAIANGGITINGGGNITIDGQVGDVDRRFFIIKASNTTVKGFTLKNTGTYMFDVAAGLSGVTIQDIIASQASAVMDNVVYVFGASTNMTIKNIMVLSGMQECVGNNVGRPFYFQNGIQTNLLIEDVTAYAICEGIVFRDASVNGLNIINTTIYGSYQHIVFDNTGGPVETANNVTIDGENTASLYSQRDGGSVGMIYSDFINTNWQIKNLVVDADRANTTDDANYAIRFDNTTNGIILDNVTVHDAELYSVWFNGAATNITIQNSTIDNFDGYGAAQLLRFENTVTTLNITNTLIDLDQTGTTDDGDYGIVFGYGYQKTDININGLTINEADVDGIYADGPFTNFSMTASTFTNNYDGIEFYNGYNHSNININNSSFTGSGRSGILINTAAGINSGTISDNNISNNASNGLWFYSGDGNKAYTVSNNTISFNSGAGIYVNSGPDAINITQNSIFRNNGNGIELDGGGNLSYEGTNRPTITGSADLGGGMWQVNVSLPTICNAAGGCTVEVFANASSDDVEGHYFVQSFSGLAAGNHTLMVSSCAAIPCTGFPYGFWTSTLKVAATGSVSEFSNKQSMKTQGPGAVSAGVALWLDAQDAAAGNMIQGTGWLDRSGNDRDFYNTNSSDPNRSTGGLNYNHYVQFDGDDVAWRPSFTTGFTAGEVFAVTRGYYRHAQSGPPVDMGGFSGWNAHYTWSNQVLYEPFGTTDPVAWNPVDKSITDSKTGLTTVPGATTLDTRSWNIYQAGSSSSVWQTGFNGVTHLTTNTNTPQFLGVNGNPNNHIGWRGYYFLGDVAEVVFYSRVLTATERQKVQSYLALKYGTTLDQALGANNYIASDGSNMWANDGDGYKWNIFGIGRDDASPLHQKQSESIEQNAILSVAIGGTIAATNDANTTSIATDKSFLTFADNNQLQRFGPAVSATNSNFRMHRTWKVDKSANWTDANVTFQFGEDFAGNYLLISPNAAFSSISSEILLDSMGRATFNSSLLAHDSYFTVGAKMQLPGCVSPPVVSYPNYQEYYNAAIYPFLGAGGIGYGYNTNPATQASENNIAYSGYYGRNFTNSFSTDNYAMVYRAKLSVPSNGTYTFYLTSDDNADLRIDGQYVAGVVTCCYTNTGIISLTAGTHDIEVRMAEGGGGDYVTVEYSGPSIGRQVIPVSALASYTAPGVQTWLKADQGVVTSGTVTRWNDVSGNNNDAYQTNAAYNPTYNSGNSINFNPSVNAVGGQGLLFKKTIPPTNNLTMFAVGKSPSPAVRTLANGTWLNAATNDHFILFDDSNNFAYFDGNNVGWKYSGQTITTNVPYLAGMSHNAAANTAQPRLNGKNGTVLTGINEDDVDYYQQFLNYAWQGGNQGAGDVAEFVAVSDTLSPTDVQKIESYLALKYGISLDQTTPTNYLASNGSTTMWNATDNGIYKNDIAGIGKDLCQGLHQKQSKSVNSDGLVTMAVGSTIAATNAANAATVTADNSYLTWANNDLATTFLTNVTGNPSVNLRMARVWKADKTNWTDGDVAVNLTGGNAQNYLVISNTDPTFATINQVLQLNASGSVTFSSSLLQDGAYFTFGKRIIGPACVNAGIASWWRADDNAADSLWMDYSGNQKDAAQATLANRPTLVSNGVNFNPAYDFNGSTQWLTSSSLFTGTGAFNTQIYAVSYTNNVAQQQVLFGEYMSNGGYMYAHAPWTNAQGYWFPPNGYGVAGPWIGTQGIPDVWSFLRTPTQIDIYENRKQIATQNGAYANIAGNNSPFYLARRADGYLFNGRVAELIVYNNSAATTATQRQQIESYLALKYGITMDQTIANNYLASDGTTKMWDATINSAYKTDIAGIGKDVCTGLHQKQSKSVNTGNLITMATGGSVAASNQANTNDVTNDLSFLVWGHNNLATAFGPVVTGVANATARMSRVWKVDKTNWADQNITICAGQTGDRYLLINTTDAAFGAGTTEHTMNFATGCVTINSSLLPDGAYFTMGTKIVGPACVNAGIQVWLRSDYGTGTTTDNTGVATWADFSGNSFAPSQPTATAQPTYKDNAAENINFNATLKFDAGDWMENTVAPLIASNNFTLIAMTDQTAVTQWGSIISYNRSGNSDRPIITNMDATATIGMNRVNISGAGPAITTPAGPFIIRTQGNATNVKAEANGGALTSTVAGWAAGSGATLGYYLGRHNITGYLYNGTVSEVIAYNRELTAAELERVESYLALKYGVTLKNGTQNYVDNDGTIYWNATTNTGFASNIAGIGKDDCTDLHQKQSKSVNTGEILTVALGSSVAASNVANTNTVTTDQSFLVWGNNNGLNEFANAVTSTNVTAYLDRVWRVDKTANWADQNITLCFEGHKDDEYLIISNASSTFAALNQEKQLSNLGCVTFNSSELPDGAYFSIGKKIVAPGCVVAGIVTWLDAQDVASGNMINGVGWGDKSGNNKYFNTVNSDPARVDAGLNYNHYINFDGNDYLQSTQSPFVNDFTAAEALVITKSNGQFNGQANPYDFGSGSRGSHYSWGNGHYYNGFGTTQRLGFDPETNTIVEGKAGVASITGTNYAETSWNLLHNYSAANDWAVGFNGLFKATTTTNTTNFGLVAGNENIGGFGGAPYSGEIAEVVLYRRKLTAPERQKVMSYLALKYGMTLDTTVTDQDYIASDGSTIWDWSDNNNYQHDIAGIGREDCQKLNQKQSKSINGDDPLAIAVGNFTTFPVSNEANTTTITNDKSFLVWSNNNGALTFTTAVPKVGINGTFHTLRKWKIDKNGFADQMLTISVGQSGERYLLVDEDGSGGFENDANTKEYAFDFTTGLLNINSSSLPDGAVITLATKISGPACVNSGIQMWLRGDYGTSVVTDNSEILNWSDYSGNNTNVSTVPGSAPLYNSSTVNSSFNFNPSIKFDQTGDYLRNTLKSTFSSNSSDGEVFYVSNPTANGKIIGFNTPTATGGFVYDYPWLGTNSGFYRDGNISTTLTSNPLNVTGIHGRNWNIEPSVIDTAIARFNGRDEVQTLNNNFLIGTAAVGLGFSGDDIGLIGNIGEMVVYNRKLSAAERQQVESYLALKYGITLNQTMPTDYLASDGTTIMWDASDNAGYINNIAGIGIDTCTELYQKQSKSVNTGEILTGALGNAVETSNAANTTAFANSDLSFLVWGHNNGTNDFTQTLTASGSNSMAYLGRVWKADKTNFSDQNITLCFTGYDADEYLLVSDASSTFATVDYEAALNASGCVTLNSSEIPDGAFFTLGKNIQGPACVDGGIKLWLRADGTTVTDSLWADYSGNGNDAFQNTAANRPVPTDNIINFNPAMVFDGVNTDAAGDWMDIPNFTDIKSSFWVVQNNASDNDYDHVLFSANGNTGSSMHGGNGTLSYTGNGMNADANNVWRKDGGTADQNTPYDDNPGSKPNLVSFVSTNRNVTADFISYQPGWATRKWNGPIAEVVLYNKALSAMERQQVESYLALKYGITINQTIATNYIASDGSNIWNATDNGAYKNDIAGIGQDMCTGLNQKQSKSVNTNSLITMALGNSVATTNAGNPNTVTNDKSFLVWAHNGLATTFTTAFAKTGFTNVNKRTPRTWKVDKTNWADQDITICVGQTGERYLLIDNGGDGNFLDDPQTSVHALDFGTGCVTINSSLLPDGAHFSLGTEISGPACVNGNIVAWLRADYGANGVNWSDYSGNSNNPTATSDPGLDATTTINFNPAFYYDGNDAHILPATADLTTGNYSMFTVSKLEGTQNGRAFTNGVTNDKLFGYWGGYEDQLYLNGTWLNGPYGTVATTKVKMYSLQRNSTGSGPYEFRDANRVIKTGATSDGSIWRFNIGGTSPVNNEPSKVYVPEVAVYNADLTATDVNKIESYFGLKYGMTLDQATNTDYVASNWNGTTGTKMWTNDNDNFESDIAGIGKDICTNLHQKQSASVNTGNIFTVALGGTVETTNALNTNAVTNDLSFLTWAHNGGALDFTTTATGTNATARLDRVWKVDKTNWADQNITVCFGATYANNYLIINNTDGNFPTVGLEYQLNASGCYTLNSSDLPDGAFFTIGKNIEGPACVNGGIKMWLKADDGTASGAQWNDASGNSRNATQGTGANQPTVASSGINFNPGLTFDGSTKVMTFSNTGLPTGNNEVTLFAVATNSSADNNCRAMFGYGTAAASMAAMLTQCNSFPTFDYGGTIQGNVAWNKPTAKIVGGSYLPGSPNVATVYDNGRTAGTNNPTLNIGNGIGYIGDNTAAPGGANRWNGNLSEVVIYNKVLTATERQKVNSYLALKYGITMDQTIATDYLASDGTNMWDASDNGIYKNDITGIGKDDCTNLHQKQSKSVNANSLITIATGSAVAASNVANTTAVINDKSFFTWANNGLVTTFSTGFTKTGAQSTARTPRIWKVDKTNWQDQDITICVGQTGERYLLIDNGLDADFDNDGETSEYTMDFSTGCVTLNSSLIPDGAHFSLGTKISGPACVNTGIAAWWRADYGATAAQWTDFSGNSKNATQGTVTNQPTLQTNGSLAINFNPAFDFDGNDELNVSDVGFPSGGAARSVIAIVMPDDAGSGDVNGRVFSYGTNGVGQDWRFDAHNTRIQVDLSSSVSRITEGANSVPMIATVRQPLSTNAAGMLFYKNGKLGTTSTIVGNATINTILSGVSRLGKDKSSNAYFNGRIAEVAFYSQNLSDADRGKIESYLALKYGITLDQTTATDYLASNGMIKMWDATANTGYNNNIAGIGKDTCTELHQKQSKSVNAGEILTVALGSSVAASNAANANTVTNNLSFLVWGHNNGINDFTQTVTASTTTSMAYLGRVWKADKTSWADQDITLCFSGYDENSYLLVSNSSATFATVDAEQQLGTDGCVTFNSGLLSDGAFFTLGKVIQGPACVDGGIAAWFRIDQGIMESGTISNWADASGNGVDVSQSSSGAQPTYQNTTLMNFHPTASYDGGDVLKDTLKGMVGNQPYTIFAIHKPNNVQGNLFAIGNPATNTNIAYFPVRTSTNNRLLYHFNDDLPSTPIRTDWQLNTLRHDALASGTDRYLYDEGKLVTSNAAGILNLPTNPIFSVGGYDNRAGVDGEEYNGQLVEFVVYKKSLSAAERNRVESYLALKYGITLDQTTPTDYLASDGTNMWDASDNAGYGFDITGIGKDECTGLHQKQSNSINSDNIVTAYLGSTTYVDNASNPGNITNDKSFFTWSNDNQATTLDVPFMVLGSGVQARMARTWKVDKTNWQDQNITLCFGQSGERFLLVDEGGDGDFVSNPQTKVYGLNFATGCITLNTDKFPDGANFTIGTKLVAPACVQESNISAWWKADYSASGASWSDFSGNNKTAVQANPTYQATLTNSAINFNPALNFDGTDDHLLMNIDDIRNSNYSYFAVGFREDNNLNYILGTPGGSTNVDLHFGYNSNTVLRLGQFGNDLDVTVPAFDNPAMTVPYMHFGRLDQSVGHLIQERRNGTRYNATNSNITPLSGTTQEYIGRFSTNYYKGKMAEVVVYREALTDADARKVMSYLAIKYGLTLEVFSPAIAYDYTSSTGSNIWSAVDNYDYRFNIAGIGRDSCTELLQKQSKSTNSGAIVTMALGAAVEASNAENTSTLEDLAFLTWGNNNSPVDYTESVVGSYTTSRLGRTWRLDKTNFTNQEITICFDGYDDSNYLLVSNASATFATLNVESQLDATGCVTINSIFLPDGAYFTLGKTFFGPACVNGAIKLWVRADDGTLVGNMTNWNDQSSNVNHAITVSSDPSLTAVGVNYNPVVNFDGNDGLRGNFTTAVTSNDLTVIAVGNINASTVSNGRLVSGATNSSNDNDNINSFNLSRLAAGNPLNWDRSTDLNSTGNYVNNGFHLFTGIAGGDGANVKFRANGIQTATSSFPTGAFNLQRFGIGEAAQGGTFLNGDIAEVAIYGKELTGTDLDKVESYFALKYGISLNQTTDRDYIASNGTLIWGNDGDGFEGDIAGIGRDSCTGLYQKQSSSINADDIVTIALGNSIQTSNATNTATISTDRTFFTWANNSGATNAFDEVVTGAANADRRLPRVWKVDKSATWADQTMTICFEGQIGERYLVIDNTDPAMVSVDTEIPLNPLTGCATINTSNFQNNAYFSLATNLLGPGCAANVNVLLWLRGDYNATAPQWNDFSGNARNATQVSVGNQPAPGGLMNFNPAMTFGNDDYFTINDLDINSNQTDRDPLTTFVIYEPAETDEPIWGNENGSVSRYLYSNLVSTGTGSQNYTGGNTINQPTLVATIMDDSDVNGTTSGSQVYVNGGTAQSFPHSSSNGGYSYTFLGDDNGTGADMFTGKIAEFAVYRGALTAAQRRQAESYFALKYGLQLNVPTAVAANNYLASNGSSMWDATTYFAHRFDLAGIGRDDCGALIQKQSRSANSDYLVTAALGNSIAVSNAANASVIPTDLSFFVWGNNDGVLEFNTPITDANVTSRLARVWRVDKTNWTDQDITLCFNGYDNLSYFLVSSSATFATVDLSQQLNAQGCITISSSSFSDGSYFTLGQNLNGPACVNTEIQFWLRSDYGTGATNDGDLVSTWQDYSGNNYDGTGAGGNRPSYESDATNLINFHPALNFDGTDDYLENTVAPLLNSTDFTLFTVTDLGTFATDRGVVSYNRSTNSTRPIIGTTGTTPNIGINSVGVSNAGPSVSTTTLTGAFLMRTQGEPSDVYASANGAASGSLYSTTVGWGSGTGAANGYFIGRRNNAGGYYNGRIAEVVAYSRPLAAFEIQKVESYLAVKYGISLDQTTQKDYVASDWDGASGTIFWDAAANGNYKYDITGIGQDDCTDLNQKQSKASNSDDILTIGLNTIAATNALNTNTFPADNTFMMWANDNGGITQVNTDLPTALAANSLRLQREWKIDKTNLVDSVLVEADLSSLSLSSTPDEISIMIDRDGDGDFTTGTIDIIDAVSFTAGIATFGKVIFEDGDVFTIATELPLANLQLKVFLQGPYNTTSHLMNTTLASLDLLPATDPYGLGVTPVNTNPNDIPNVVDWVKIEIRDGATPTTIVKEIVAYVTADGTVVDTAGNTTIALGMIAGDYKIAVRHRNHLGIMTNNNVVFSGPTALAMVDFTVTSPSHGVYGTNGRVEVESGVWAMWGGDVNGDGKIFDASSPSDSEEIIGGVLFHVDNSLFVSNFPGYSNIYDILDINLDGNVYDAASPSDSELIIGNVLFHPLNTLFISNFPGLFEQLP